MKNYIRARTKWRSLDSLSSGVRSSSAVVLGDVLYNLGGHPLSYSVTWLDLASQHGSWNSLKTVGEACFLNHSFRGATLISNKIVYFGSRNENATYILEKEERSGILEVMSKFAGIEYRRGEKDASFCTYQEKIYFFPTNSYSQVFCLDIETEEAALFF